MADQAKDKKGKTYPLSKRQFEEFLRKVTRKIDQPAEKSAPPPKQT